MRSGEEAQRASRSSSFRGMARRDPGCASVPEVGAGPGRPARPTTEAGPRRYRCGRALPAARRTSASSPSVSVVGDAVIARHARATGPGRCPSSSSEPRGGRRHPSGQPIRPRSWAPLRPPRRSALARQRGGSGYRKPRAGATAAGATARLCPAPNRPPDATSDLPAGSSGRFRRSAPGNRPLPTAARPSRRIGNSECDCPGPSGGREAASPVRVERTRRRAPRFATGPRSLRRSYNRRIQTEGLAWRNASRPAPAVRRFSG